MSHTKRNEFTERLDLMLSPHAKRALKRHARRQGLDMSEAARKAIDAYNQEQELQTIPAKVR